VLKQQEKVWRVAGAVLFNKCPLQDEGVLIPNDTQPADRERAH